jgi:TonB-dependent starch-binding outer membrane protein SusC
MECSIRRWLGATVLGCLTAVLVATSPLAAQTTGTVQGTVREAMTQRTLSSVQVHIPSMNRGVLSNADGRYQLINLPAGTHVIRFQRIGYATVTQTVTVAAGEPVRLDVEMTASAVALDEVVVSGTGGQAVERRKLGNTIASINVGQLDNAPIISFSEILQGREPGVAALPSGGMTGEGTRIRIRGTSSLSQSNEPLVYVDGIRVDNKGGIGIWTGGGGMPSRLDDIDPASIDRIEILKGAAAATLYGSEASGGVIQIFTRRGSIGEPRWELQMEQGRTTYPDVFKSNAGFAKPLGGRTAEQEAARLSQLYGTTIRPYEVFEQRFVNDLLGAGTASTLSGSVTGGSEGITYYVSGRYQHEDGPIQSPFPDRSNDVSRRAQGTATLSIVPIDNVTIRVGTLYTEGRLNMMHNNNNIFAPMTLAMFGKPELAGCPVGVSNLAACGTERVNMRGNSAFATVLEGFNKGFRQDLQRFTGSIGTTYTPTRELSWELVFGVDAVNQMDNMFYPFGWNVEGFATQDVEGTRTIYNRAYRQLSADNRVSWNTDLTPSISSAFSLGAQFFLNRADEAWATGTNFPGPGFEVVGAGAVQTNVEQWMSEISAGVSAQQQFGYNDYVFLTLGARYDRHSAFGEAVGGQIYPKASVSYVVSDMPAWNNALLSTLRLRTAIGTSGKQPGAFDQFTSFAAIRSGVGAGIAPDNLGSPDLRPEVTTEWEAGAELGLFNDRVALDLTYWNRSVDDVLVARQFPVSGGFRLTQLDNVGTLSAQGAEVGLRGTLLNTPSLSINAFANTAYLWERVTSLGGAPPLRVGGSYTRYRNFIKEGYAPGAFFGPVLADADIPIRLGSSCSPATRAELEAHFSVPRGVGAGWDALVKDCGGDFMNNYLGKPTPDWQGSFGLDASFLRNFRLSTLFEYKAGNYYVHNLTDAFRTHNPTIGRNIRGAAEAEAAMLNPASTPQQRADAAIEYARKYFALSPYDGLNEMEQADFVRWRELALTYTVPTELAQRIGARNLAITASGRNLMLWTKYGGIDPETNVFGQLGVGADQASSAGQLGANVGMGIDGFGIPIPRRFSLSARVGF